MNAILKSYRWLRQLLYEIKQINMEFDSKRQPRTKKKSKKDEAIDF